MEVEAHVPSSLLVPPSSQSNPDVSISEGSSSKECISHLYSEYHTEMFLSKEDACKPVSRGLFLSGLGLPIIVTQLEHKWLLDFVRIKVE
ncbi:hypothetical protein V2J09_019127 [Rumex salicifolius]